MAIQLILCVETNKRADTDSIYISEMLNHYFVIDNNVKISKVYMNTKTKYKSNDVLREIKEKTDMYTFGDTKVIYCVDTDDYERNSEQEKSLEDISKFCDENGYELAWFCHDVEEVFLGKRISDSHKVREAGMFRRKQMIKQQEVSSLMSTRKNKRMSNVMLILDKYLVRK